ncbi:hypothetical protein NMG60_11002215 [Bertholletia excelsa]
MAGTWLSTFKNVVFSCKEAVSAEMAGFRNGSLFNLLKKAAFAVLTCSFALGGATVGTIAGAIKGQTTETGCLGGAAIGALGGAVTAVQLVELLVRGEPFSKVGLFFSLINGKVFMEWVTPAVLKAYQFQMDSGLEASSGESSDIFETNGARGLPQDSINNLPKSIFHPSNAMRYCSKTSCIICLEDFKNGDFTRILQSCGHCFHLHCIDQWLVRHGACPVCRREL